MARHSAIPSSGHSAFRPGRGRRRQRPAVGRHPARGAARAIPTFYDAHPAASGRGQRRRARARSAATLGDVADRLASSGAGAARVVRGRADRQRTARRAAGASGRDARGRTARGLRRRLDDRAAVCDSSRARCRRPRSPSISIALGVALEPGWRVEINLRAVDWIRDAARRLRRGFIILIDYGHEARELYSATHSAGTLTTFARHRSGGPEASPRRAAVAAAARRAGPHRARRLHQRPRGRGSRGADDARLSRSDVLPAGPRSTACRSRDPHVAQSRIEDADACPAARQHAQGADPRQRRRHAGAAAAARSGCE